MANEQEMSVHDKENPTLGATWEEQDMSTLNRIVVPVGAFTDPHNLMSHSLSVNLPLNDAPLRHSEDYGKDILPGVQTQQSSPLSVGAQTLTQVEPETVELPADREEWSKADWQKHAKSRHLAVSGSIDAIRQRVEEDETTEEQTNERAKELNAMKRDELDELAKQYDLDPDDFSHKDDLAEAILAEETSGS